MSRNIFVISDTHFGHDNIIKYCNRPFESHKDMDDFILTKWNETVKDNDIVYHLGDVYIGKRPEFLRHLKGRKRLILGNHDNGKDQLLGNVFEKITVWRMFPEFGVLLTHVPVHESSLNPEKCPINVHGHIHDKESPSKNHINVSCERINYTPVNIEEVRNYGSA